MSSRYFSQLNYTLANEDTALEMQMVELLKPKKTLVVCGSGGRSLPLGAHTQEHLAVVDLSPIQLSLAQLRQATIEQCEYSDFLKFWGFPPFSADSNQDWRGQQFALLNLSDAVRREFADIFVHLHFSSPLYAGKWERTFTGIAKIARKFVGGHYDEIFKFSDLKEQNLFFDTRLKSYSWKFFLRLVLRVVGNASFFNALLYKGDFVRKNIPESYFDFYRQAFRRLFYQGLCRENFFLQICFLGKLVYPEGNPSEAQSHVFAAMKANLAKLKVSFHCEDVIGFAAKNQYRFDFVSLSDVPSYFSGALEKEYLQSIAPGLNLGAIVVVRCYLRVPEAVNTSGYTDVSETYRAWINQEKTQMYRVFIYQYNGRPNHSMHVSVE